MGNNNLERIKRISSKFRFLFSFLIILIPLLSLLFWIFFNQLSEGFLAGMPVDVLRPLSPGTRCLGFLVSLIPTGIAIYGIYRLRELFTYYEQGIIFSSANVHCFRHLGYTLIYWGFSKIPFVALSSIALSYNNPPGERQFVIEFGSDDVAAIVIGAVVLIISWVMYEASKLEEEQAHTV